MIDLEMLACCGEPPGWVDCGIQVDELAQLFLDRQGSYLAPVSWEWAACCRLS